MKRALVLAGGGARGSYQVGMLQELVINQGFDFEVIRGVSAGALNASFLAQASMQGDSLQNLKDRVALLNQLWTEQIQGNRSVYCKRFPLGLLFGANSCNSNDPLKRLINEQISIDDLRNSGRDFEVGTVSLVSGRYCPWSPADDNFIEKLIASGSVPFVFPYVEMEFEKEALVDGGLRDVTPLGSAFAAEPEEIYVLLTSRLIRENGELPKCGVPEHDYSRWEDNFLGTKVTALDILKRTVEIILDEIYLNDICDALNWNTLINEVEAVVSRADREQNLSQEMNAAIETLKGAYETIGKRYVPLYVLAPREWYGDHNDGLDFSPELISRAIEHGRQVAADSRLWLWPP